MPSFEGKEQEFSAVSFVPDERSTLLLYASGSVDMTSSESAAKDNLYAGARRTLEKALRDPDKFSEALGLAIIHCEEARAYDWCEVEIRQRGRDVKKSWDSTNAAALKLAKHFETIDRLTGYVRLSLAWEQVAMSGIKKMPPAPPGAIIAALLRALSNQTLRTERKGWVDHGYTFGPLRIGKSSRRMPSREVALTVALAHIFDRVMAHEGPRVVLRNGETIESGRAWEASADFASAAFGCAVDANAAKKYLRDHRGHLSLRTWPKPCTRPV